MHEKTMQHTHDRNRSYLPYKGGGGAGGGGGESNLRTAFLGGGGLPHRIVCNFFPRSDPHNRTSCVNTAAHVQGGRQGTSPQGVHLLLALRLGYVDNALVTPRPAHVRQPDTRVARGPLHHGAPGLEGPLLLGVRDEVLSCKWGVFFEKRGRKNKTAVM